MSSSSGPTTTTSYWCHQCNRFVRVWAGDAVACSACGGGFLENRPNRHPETRLRQNRRALSGDRSPFNPVIVLRSPSNGRSRAENSFDLYYDDGVGSGLRPLPSGMSEFLMGSGFERLLEQVSHIGGAANRAAAGIVGGGCNHSPASKSAVDSMPTVKITSRHVKLDSHCVVCMELFEVGAEVREMPCKHIYHQECIVPWLSMRNSCPVCRHEMPGNDELAPSGAAEEEEEDPVGLTIWRLPGGGFAVGRFSAERELPVVYTEMDGGGLNADGGGGAPRRISWSNGGNRSRADGGGIVGAFRNLFSCFGPSRTRHHSRPSSSRRNNRGPTTTRRSLNG